MEKLDIQVLRMFVQRWRALVKISKSLQHSHEMSCNFGSDERREKREDKLVAKASELVRPFGLRAFEQGDPRGCALYLVPADWTLEKAEERCCPDGIAVY